MENETVKATVYLKNKESVSGQIRSADIDIIERYGVEGNPVIALFGEGTKTLVNVLTSFSNKTDNRHCLADSVDIEITENKRN